MPQVSSNRLQKSGKPPAASSVRLNKVSRPDWPEIIVGLVTSDGVYGVAIFQRRRYANGNGFYPVMVSQGLTINCFQCVRVWYRE